ncbi:MAG TPA: hypothetical protein VMF66_17280 [Candidatus Acidoferrum sp.]|nr:hypothetical protein [Candidatus Acidoferrum sp.]
MPYSFYLDSDNHIVLARFTGRVTDEVFAEFFRVGGRRGFASLQFRGAIVDFSEVTSFEVSPATVRTLAWEPPIDADASRLRIIVAPEAHIFGTFRIFASQGEDTRPNLHVVRSLEHAYVILGAVDPKFEPVAEPPAA